MSEGRPRSRTNSINTTSPVNSNHANNHASVIYLKKKQHQDIVRTIKELTSNKKRLSDSNLHSNDTIDYFTRIKNRKLKTSSLNANPNFNKFNTYIPYDRRKLVDRISTYNILNWSIDDPKLNPLTCARYGWICLENNSTVKNKIRCLTCHASMTITLEASVNINQFDIFKFDEENEQQDIDEINSEVVDKYISKLSTEHTDSCPWRSHPSPISTYMIQSYDYQDTLKYLRKMVTQLNDNKQYLTLKSFENILKDNELAPLRKWTNQQYDDLVLMISVLGWELKVQTFGYNQIILLQCHCCNRRVLIGNIKGGEMTPNDVTSNLTPSRILTGSQYPPSVTEEEDETIDLLDEHKEWCALKTGYKTILHFL